MKIDGIEEQLIKGTPLAFSFNKVIFDPEGLPVDYRLLEINPAFEAKMGLKKSEVIGRNMSEWLLGAGETQTKWFKALAEVVLAKGRREFDEILEFNGHWYLLTAFVPHPGYLIVLFYDAIKLKKARANMQEMQSSLRKSWALSESIVKNSPNAVIIYEVKGNGLSSMDYIIHSVNPTCLEIENWDEDEVIGKPLGEVRPGVGDFGIIKIFQQVWATGKTAFYPAQVYQEGKEVRWFENTVFKLNSGEIVAVYNDVTEKKQAEQEIYAQKERLKVTLHSIGEGVITTDEEGKIELLNQAAEDITGWKQEEAQGRDLSTVFDVYNERTGKKCKNPAEKVLSGGKKIELANHTRLRTRNGKSRAIADSAAPIKNPQGEILGVVLVFRDVTEAREKENRIKYLSYHDALTGLYNRVFFETKMEKLDNEDQYPLVFIMGDIDGLKLINDIFGHQVGDEALIKVAQVIKTICRKTDLISRWGGDELVILLPQTTEDTGQEICARIKEACSCLKVADTKLSISLGCATKVNGGEGWQDVLKRAENNMYKSKFLGAKSYRNMIISSMKNSLAEKSHETKEHGERLGKFCRKIGKTMGLSALKIDELELLAMLHDIGKIAIDDYILQKPGPLTASERKTVEKHAEIGYRIAQTIPELLNIAECILAHHERWDGKGYPRGLAGEEIPLLSRILAVVDAYDAITQDRPYRKALTPEVAIEELRRNAGTQFDPLIVDIFLRHLAKQNT